MITQAVQSTYRNELGSTWGFGNPTATPLNANTQPVGNNNFIVPPLGGSMPPIPDYAKKQEAPTKPQYGNLDQAHAFVDTAAQAHPDSSAMGSASSKADTAQVKKDLTAIHSGDKAPEEVLSKPFYQKNSFFKGLIASGLATMSGASPMEAYQMATEAADKAHVGEQLSDNIDELKKTYSLESIQRAIASNDASQLTPRTLTLEEQRAQQQADQAEQRAYNEQQQEKLWNRQDQQAAQQLQQTQAATKEERAYQEAQQEKQNQFTLQKEQVKEQAATQKQEAKDQKKEQQLIEQGKAGAQLLNSSLDTIEAAANTNSDNLNPIISTIRGGSVGELPAGASKLSAVSGTEARKLFQAAKQIEGSITNMGVAEAKALGASGINTEAELRTFRQAMPQLDYSSVDALKASIKRMRDYINAKGKGSESSSGGSKGALSENNQASAGEAYPIQ